MFFRRVLLLLLLTTAVSKGLAEGDRKIFLYQGLTMANYKGTYASGEISNDQRCFPLEPALKGKLVSLKTTTTCVILIRDGSCIDNGTAISASPGFMLNASFIGSVNFPNLTDVSVGYNDGKENWANRAHYIGLCTNSE